METFSPDSALVDALCPSPNCNERRGSDGTRAPDMLVLHYTGLNPKASEQWQKDPGGAALAWLVNPQAQVSSHYLVETDGRVFQLVPETLRAWHAGKSSWKGETDLNSASIGIEIVNLGHDHGIAGLGLPDYPAKQIEAVIALCQDIGKRWTIAPQRVLAHSDIAPERKGDPGEHFPWKQLFKAGIGHWVKPAPLSTKGAALAQGNSGEDVKALQGALGAYGYGLPASGDYDDLTRQVVQAFQRHFRPKKVDGIADASTRATLHALSQSLGRKVSV